MLYIKSMLNKNQSGASPRIPPAVKNIIGKNENSRKNDNMLAPTSTLSSLKVIKPTNTIKTKLAKKSQVLSVIPQIMNLEISEPRRIPSVTSMLNANPLFLVSTSSFKR